MNTNKFSWSKVTLQLLGKKAVQKIGDGSDSQFATPCRHQVNFSLWATREAAENFKRGLDRAGCYGGCEPWTHYIVDLKQVSEQLQR
jgi:hypothetical protein